MHNNSQTRAMDFERNTVGRYCLCIKPCAVQKLLTLSLPFPFLVPETDELKQNPPKNSNNKKRIKEKYYLQTLQVIG